VQLEITIDQHKSDIFLNLLNLLKQDSMIHDFKIIPSKESLNVNEQEILNDLSKLGDVLQNLDKGHKTNRFIEITDVTHFYRKWDFSPTKSQDLIVITIKANRWD